MVKTGPINVDCPQCETQKGKPRDTAPDGREAHHREH